MANTTTGQFETLLAVAAAGSANHTKFTNLMLDRIWLGPKSYYGTVGETMNVTIPKVETSKVTDIGAGDLAPTDTDHTTTPITLSANLSTSYVIRDFDQVRTPADLRNMFLDARMEALIRKVDANVVSQVNSTNFNAYAVVTGGDDTFTRANLATAWRNLAGGGCPVEDTANMFFTTSHVPYSNMMQDTALVNESIVGINAAESAQQRAVILKQYGASLGWDQLFPATTNTYPGLFHHRNAIAMVTARSPQANAPNVIEAVVYPKPGLAVRVQLGYDIVKQGWVCAMNCIFGVAVVRPEFGQALVTT